MPERTDLELRELAIHFCNKIPEKIQRDSVSDISVHICLALLLGIYESPYSKMDMGLFTTWDPESKDKHRRGIDSPKSP